VLFRSRDFKVSVKKPVGVPKEIVGVIKCPNPNCITNTKEPVKSKFVAHPRGFRCQYCDSIISREMDIGDYI
jgi:aspartate carbamoyltransferase regulatory subunit